jgi:crotonobetainyl-CoA:carnitine CoA-transferase CaiB-like acyl-CoA transferase
VRVVDLSADVAGRFCAKLLGMGGAAVVGHAPGAAWAATAGHAPGAAWAATAGHAPGAPWAATAGHAPEALGWIDRYLGAATTVVDDPWAQVCDADVVITSFDAGRYHGGFDEAQVRAANPSVVHITTSTFGTTGPYARLRGGPLAGWAAGGYLQLTGEPDREPLPGPRHLCGYVAGYTAAIAAEAALAAGGGVHADISVMESMLSVHQSTFSRLAAGIVRQRTGRYTEVYPLVVQPCRNGYVSLGITLEEEYDRFVTAIGRPELAVDPRFVDREARAAHRDAFDAEIGAFLAGHDAEEIVALLQANRIPCSKVESVQELLANPQLAARGYWDALGMPGNPVRAQPLAAAGAAGELARATNRGRGDSAGGVRRRTSGLAGALVLDFTTFWAGPSATRTLADLGADVVRIERPGSRVDVDGLDAGANQLVQDVFFHWKMNRGKRSIVVDLKSGAGRELVARLARQADVVIENFRPGVMASFGLDAALLATDNPGLVYVSLSGMGATGPRAWWGSYGPTIEAASSIEHRTRYRGGPPLRLGHTLPDGVGGLAGALAVLIGLRLRAETGAGSYFDISQLEAYAALSGEDIAEVAATGAEPAWCSDGGVYRCSGDDAWVAVDGGPVEVDASRTKEEVAASLQAAGVGAFPVLGPLDLVTDAHLAARGYLARPVFDGRTVALPGSAIVSDPPLVHFGDAAPRFGEHTRAIAASLGYSGPEVDALIESGVLYASTPALPHD